MPVPLNTPFTRREFLKTAASAAFGVGMRGRLTWDDITRPTPSAPQLRWQRDERAMFTHFGVNTFTNREWGDGTEDPAIFDPTALDPRQWARVARRTGFRAMVLTAKHHDGFCLWPSRYTDHTVAHSPWKQGHGDVVREFVAACRAEGLRPGLYLSPWDRHEPSYGDSPRYNDFYCDQLTELLSNYGPIAEVWFDGANGEGPNGKKQAYDWPRFFGLVRRLQPNAVIFSDAGPDVRWIGNEKGVAGDPNWSTVDPAVVPYPGASGPGITEELQHGDPHGSAWRPGESDVSIRPGWFYHPAEDDKVRSPDDLMDLYFSSVGRNSKLLLNVPPTREGLLHPTDVAHLTAFDAQLTARFHDDLAAGGRTSWHKTGATTGVLTMDLPHPATVGLVSLSERIEQGQCVARYSVAGWNGSAWKQLSAGATIGYKKLDRMTPAEISRIRVTIDDALAEPRLEPPRLYRA